ncbi:endonuclease domain-containing protein [Ruania halotolerans]|uniref:endonuclease domain-containing protein n=1 Tax=Ruania halotolerans TaxID=2897773 RepID=UPI001E5B59FD|nr:endonuclease domain-containing protein [Ruania halotolerans]UFU07683.1 endonuclease domain-containing protein [Ruania halotolerans]
MIWIENHAVAAVPDALAQALVGLNRENAVAVLDSALFLKKISPEDFARLPELLRKRPGCRRVRPWIDLVDGRAESPLETWARLSCMDAGIPVTDLQVELYDEDGIMIARGDLGWQRSDGTWVIAEIDGRGVHSQPAALYQDRSRQNRVLLGGHTMLRFTNEDLRSGTLVNTVAAAVLGPTFRDLGVRETARLGA